MADTRLLYDSIVADLATATGFQIGDGAAPSGISIPDDLPYAVVYGIGEIDRTVAMNELAQDGDLVTEVQITSVGETRTQATGLADLVRSSFVASILTWTGRRIHLVEQADGTVVERDDDLQPPIFYAIDSYYVYSSAA